MTAASFLGDAGRLLAMINAALFSLAVFLDHDLFDDAWKEQGYCIMDPNIPYGTSHDYCLYVGVFLAVTLKTTVFLLQEEPGMQLATKTLEPKSTIFLGHAIIHGFFASGLRWEQPTNPIASVYIPFALYMLYSWREYKNPVKGFEYALFPWLVEIPLGAVAWIESTQCSQWVIRVWGHLLYDVYWVLSMLLFCMICWVKASLTVDQKKKYKAS